MKKSKRFRIEELVCKDVFTRDGEKAWRYFRPVAIDFIDWYKEEVDTVVYINNWLWKGDKDERGLRCNLCPIVSSKKGLYVSAHMLGAGFDITTKGKTADESRKWIHENIHRFFELHPEYKAKCRLESSKRAPTWMHIDFYDHDSKGIVQEF
jgi:hypothetical protein